jgi:SPP1 family phage portal protein
MILRDRKIFENGIPKEALISCLREHMAGNARLDKLERYYGGIHDILKRESKGDFAPNNKIVNNYAKFITDTLCGYFMGNPIKYSDETEQNLDALNKILKTAGAYIHDSELEKDLSVFGRGCELIYMSDGDPPVIKLGLADPRNAFAVFDTSIENRPIFGAVCINKIGATGQKEGYRLTVYDENEAIQYESADVGGLTLISRTPHHFGGVPFIEYRNNEEAMGDFEGVITLIDAYNILQSDRVNDKERFVDAILVITNAQLERADALELINSRILQLPGDASAGYITKALDESQTQILAQALEDDIHKFSQTPDFSDRNFAGNSSGVAMAYKLLSLENLAKVKERFFTEGINKRLKLINAILKIKGAPLALDTIKIVMNRTTPVNELELAQIITSLKGSVSTETLLSKLPFVEDVQKELEKVNAEREITDARLKETFGVRETADEGRL